MPNPILSALVSLLVVIATTSPFWLNLGGWNNTQHGVESIVNGAKSQIATTPGSIETGKWYDIVCQLMRELIDMLSLTGLDDILILLIMKSQNYLPGFVANLSCSTVK